MLGFKDSATGELIFKEWRSQIGEEDKEEKIHISIITDIDKENPSHYRVLITTNPNAISGIKGNQFIMVNRSLTMVPPDLHNLNNFINEYNLSKSYLIVPAQVVSETTIPRPVIDLGILKHEISIRQAWQIGENDPDISAIQIKDNPMIPPDITDAPVKRALSRFDRRRRRKATAS